MLAELDALGGGLVLLRADGVRLDLPAEEFALSKERAAP